MYSQKKNHFGPEMVFTLGTNLYLKLYREQKNRIRYACRIRRKAVSGVHRIKRRAAVFQAALIRVLLPRIHPASAVFRVFLIANIVYARPFVVVIRVAVGRLLHSCVCCFRLPEKRPFAGLETVRHSRTIMVRRITRLRSAASHRPAPSAIARFSSGIPALSIGHRLRKSSRA